jgi:hypothetical protein
MCVKSSAASISDRIDVVDNECSIDSIIPLFSIFLVRIRIYLVIEYSIYCLNRICFCY